MTEEKTYKVFHIEQPHVFVAWKDVRNKLEPAIEASNGRWHREYVFAALLQGTQQLWTVVDGSGEIRGVATTEIMYYPERRTLTIHFLGGGDFEDWYTRLMDALIEFAGNNDCDALECTARHGFWKMFQKHGFKRPSTFYEKDLREKDDVSNHSEDSEQRGE